MQLKVNIKQVRKIFGLPKYACLDMTRILNKYHDSGEFNQFDFTYSAETGIQINSIKPIDYLDKPAKHHHILVWFFTGNPLINSGKFFITSNSDILVSSYYHYTYIIHWNKNGGSADDFLWYAGKTSQGIANRLKQHIYGITTGSSKVYRIARDEKRFPLSITAAGAFKNSDLALDNEELIIDHYSRVGKDKVLNVMKNRYAYQEFINVFGRKPKSTEGCEEQFAAEYQKQDRIMGFEQRMAIADRDRNFSEQEVHSIRLLLAMGEPPKTIGEKMNVRYERIMDIVKNNTYKGVGEIL